MHPLKIMSLNLHCLVEENLEDKQQRIASTIAREDVDVVLLQEVAQTQVLDVVHDEVKEDNYAYTLQQLLHDKGSEYYLEYIAFKASFNKYDEGLAMLSKYPLHVVSTKQISKISSYQDWKRRKILVCQMMIDDQPVVFGNTHFGWSDDVESFTNQFDLAFQELPSNELAFIGGDFNIKPTTDEYKHIISSGLIDLFDDGEFRTKPTHANNMDVHTKGSRIDYIMSNRAVEVVDRKIVFEDNLVSDHFGIIVTVNLK